MVPLHYKNSRQHQSVKQRWNCRQCGKSLSSKRSFDEHMNIHNKTRPFACDECDYAASSQMTLRRHKLRNHIPRDNWGYQCPYCGEQYMEPASYQQHVIARHWGLSATFGCPYGDCTFTTKSSRFFREHLSKHQAVIMCRTSKPNALATSSTSKLNLDNLALYLINDECGNGNWSGPMSRNSLNAGRRLQPKQFHTNTIVYPALPAQYIDGREKVSRINVEKLLEDDEEEKRTEPRMKFRPWVGSAEDHMSRHRREKTTSSNNSGQSYQQQPQSIMDDAIVNWIEAEVVIDEEADNSTQLLDGQIDDFGLD